MSRGIFGAVVVLFAASGALAQDPTILEKAVELGATTLVKYISKAGLNGTFNSAAQGPFTVFAPTNEAFEALPQAVKDSLDDDSAFLAAALNYHVLPEKVESSAITNNLMADTLATKSIRFNVYSKDDDEKVITASGREVVKADQMASNGVIHVVNGVLMAPIGNLVQYVSSEQATLSTLLSAVNTANLGTALAGTGPFTLFAPSNDAFAKIPTADLTNLLADTDKLTAVLQYHLVDAASYSAGLSNLESPLTQQGQNARVSISSDGKVYLDNAMVTKADITVDNGVVHVIDTVLMPPQDDLVEAITQKGLSTLVDAVTTAELATLLQGEGPFTLFAPSQQAFEDFGEDELKELLDDKERLTALLKYHVISGTAATSFGLRDEQEIETAEGKKVEISIEDDGTVEVNDIEVTEANILAKNGVIHVIDGILDPTKVTGSGIRHLGSLSLTLLCFVILKYFL